MENLRKKTVGELARELDCHPGELMKQRPDNRDDYAADDGLDTFKPARIAVRPTMKFATTSATKPTESVWRSVSETAIERVASGLFGPPSTPPPLVRSSER